jgi:DNA recombination protein RmuC
MFVSLIIVSIALLMSLGVIVFLVLRPTSSGAEDKITQLQQTLIDRLNDQQLKAQALQHELQTHLQTSFSGQTEKFDASYLKAMKMLQDSLGEGRKEMTEHLRSISGQVEKRLNEGFEKTTATFTDIIKRLALIDEAQKRITELSSNVMSLKELLSDKRSRGAFGEVQLATLIRNVLPEQHFALQHTLSNGKRPDCMLFLPDPTGNIAIDAKFPLETYQHLMELDISEAERKTYRQQFKKDIMHHIRSISEKYVLPNETAEGAVMFIPAESVFAEIHAHFPELVEASHRAKVWMASPTTMMAILTTVRAVLKDDATRKQVHVIQKHLQGLSQDFSRFQKRMDGLERHISQANDDVKQVNISAKKITSQFDKIEAVELTDTSDVAVVAPVLT